MADFAQRRGLDVDSVKQSAGALKEVAAKYNEIAVDVALAAGGAVPGVGWAADAAALSRSLGKGDLWGAAFDVVGFLPGAGDAIKGAKVAVKAGKARRALNLLKSTVAKSFIKTESAAKAFWKSTGNPAAYKKARNAIKGCDGTAACKKRLADDYDKAAKLKGKQYGSTPRTYSQTTGKKNGDWIPADGRGDGRWRPADTPENAALLDAIKPRKTIDYENGFPKFDRYSKGEVKIPQTGDTGLDLSLATQMHRKKIGDPNWKIPEGYTWHHKEDGTTMQLVPSAINGNASHAGGQALFGTTSTGREF